MSGIDEYERIAAQFDAPHTNGSAFRFQHICELVFTPPRYLIRPLSEADCLALVFGDPGWGKSFLGIDMAACIATGTDFHGCAVNAGPVAIICGEGRNGLARRIRAWETRRQISLENAPLFVSGGPAALCHPTAALQVAKAVDDIAELHGAPVLIIVDTVARNFGPGDESSTQDMTAFIQAADMIRTRHQATVLLIHHTGHADKSRARGAMALKGALDAEYRMDKDDTGVVRLEATKMKDGPEPEPLAFRIRSVELGDDDDGNSVTSAVLDDTSYSPPPKAGKAGRGKWQTVALEVLRKLHSDKRAYCEASGRDEETARVAVEHWREACIAGGMPRQRFAEVRESLPQQDIIEVANGFAYLR